jgi:hypothetical protein
MPLSNYSDISQVKQLAKKYLGNVLIEPSTRKDKKYMLVNPETHKIVHFGQMGYEDFTKHKDKKRRDAFLKRNASWKNAPIYSPAWLSYHLLW